ncbi:MAG: ComEC/Rec2 family competence protein [Spirochaetaceae bacterium]|nr:ComEC/Rec2 family competence protein [Spirochaetaceae bacterium]
MAEETTHHPIRITPAVAAAGAAVGYLLGADHLPSPAPNAVLALLLAAPAGCLAAAAQACGGACRRLLLAAAAGCVLAGGAELGERIAGAGAGAGLPMEQVDELHGVLLQDASLRDAGVHYRIAVDQVGSARLDARASARFVAHVALPAEVAGRAYRGRRVALDGVVLFSASAGEAVRGRAEAVRRGGFAASPAAVRAATRSRLEQLILDLRGPSSALLAAVLLGDRHHLTAEQIAGFRRAGALHLLALSGLHVGLVYLLAVSAGRALAWAGMAVAPRWRRGWVAAAAVLGVAAVFVYVELAGARPSLARATTMLALARLAAASGRHPGAVNVLALSALVIVATDPRSVHELSFQLSYAALLGILLAGPPLARRLPGLLPPAARAAAGMAAGAQLTTLPLVLATFGRAHPIGLVSGLVLVPCTALFLWAGIGAVALSALSGGALDPLTRVPLHLLYSALAMLNSLFGLAPGVRW